MIHELLAEVNDLDVSLEAGEDCQQQVQRNTGEENVLPGNIADYLKYLDGRLDWEFGVLGDRFEQFEVARVQLKAVIQSLQSGHFVLLLLVQGNLLEKWLA